MDITLDITGLGKYKLKLRKGSYSGGKTALRLIDFEDGAPFANLTTNVIMHNDKLGEGEFFVKAWSENQPVVEALKKEYVGDENNLTDQHIFLDTGRRVNVSDLATAEIWKFANDTIIDQIPIL